MICAFMGGPADGALAEIPLENFWIDGTPPEKLWVFYGGKGPFGLKASHCIVNGAKKYHLLRVDMDHEMQQMVYHYAMMTNVNTNEYHGEFEIER